MIDIVFEELKEQLDRLGISSRDDFFKKYIYNTILDSELLKEIHKNQKLTMPEVLENKLILLQTIKIITLMEISKDEKELEKLSKKIKTNKKQQTKDLNDFDKILTGFLNTPKPKDQK